jgi:hypothetical protein
VETTDRIVIILPTGEAWHAVYRFDGSGLGCWDFFHDSRNPERYDRMVSGQHLRTGEVIDRVRRMFA